MDDPYASVDAMLRWQSSQLRERVVEGLAKLPTLEDPFPLPRATDGVPASWAFGSLSPYQVGCMLTEQGLRFAGADLDKVDAAIEAGNLPLAIHWLMQAQLGIQRAWSNWREAGTSRTWRYVRARRESLAQFASQGRGARTKYGAAEIKKWRAAWPDLQSRGHTKRSAARVIARRYGLPDEAVESIRKKLPD